MKKVLTLVLSVIMALGMITPGFAEGMQISLWAVNDLNEGERYGLYTVDWYEDGFQNTVTVEQLTFLRENMMKRFDAAGFKRKPTFALKAIEGPMTRGTVALIYYDVLSMYQLAEEMDPVTALKNLEVLKGGDKGLDLDGKCSTQQAVIMATRLMKAVFGQNDKGAKGIMWKVANKDITLYLVGTIHTGNNFLFPMSNRLMDAFEASDMLVLEALMNQEEIAKFQQQLYYPEGKSIRDDLSKETLAKLEKVLAMEKLQLKDVENVRAWYLMNQYTQAMISSMSSSDQGSVETSLKSIDHGQSRTELGIDNYFISKAQLSGKPMAQLESLEQQAILFNQLSGSIVDKQLGGILDFFLMTEEERNQLNAETAKSDTGVDQVSNWLNLWKNGDVEGFTKAFAPSIGEDEFSKMLFGKRDEQMALRLKSLLESGGKGTYFVAVGSGHYVGEKSIIYNLKNMGFTVEVCK